MNKGSISILVIITILMVMLPLVLMQFTNGVNWKLGDFILAGLIIFGTGLVCLFINSKIHKKILKILICGVIILISILIWAEIAVGVI